MTTLGDLLDARELTRAVDATRVRVALRFPWCVPVDEKRRRRAEELGCPLTDAGARVGEACLVSVTPGGGATLWCFGAERRDGTARPIHGEALDAWNLAQTITARDLPLFGDPAPAVEHRGFRARAVFVEGDDADDVLDGPSYGLSMCLALASHHLGVALPGDLVATAVVNGDGSLGGVDCLPRKLQLIWGSALGVTRVLVWKGQEAEAREAIGKLDPSRRPGGPPLVPVPASRLHDAFTKALHLETLAGEPRRLWPCADAALAAAERFYRVALRGSPTLLSWDGFAHTAERLGEHLAELGVDRDHRDRLAFARSVATRHASAPPPAGWPDSKQLAALPRPERLAVLAHVVQAAADGPDATAALTQAAVGRAYIEPRKRERHGSDLRVLGAVGRALAAAGRYAEARETLLDALDGWLALRREGDASYALCEALRVAALLRDEDEVGQLEATIPRVTRYADTLSSSFVWLALGRARALLGHHEAAAAALDDRRLDWDRTYSEVSCSRLRWWARAQATLGRRDAARAARLRLGALAVELSRAPDATLLARLDAAIEEGMTAVASEALRALEAHPVGGVELAKLCCHEAAPAGDERGWAAYVADHYRY